MKFQGGKSEEEVMTVVPEGIYCFAVKSSKDDTSRSGNEMITAKIVLFKNGKQLGRDVTDYLLESMAEKLRHFCVTTGKMDAYNAGSLDAASIVGCSGMVKISVEAQPGYRSKNVVDDYVARPEGFVEPKLEVESEVLPF